MKLPKCFILEFIEPNNQSWFSSRLFFSHSNKQLDLDTDIIEKVSIELTKKDNNQFSMQFVADNKCIVKTEKVSFTCWHRELTEKDLALTNRSTEFLDKKIRKLVSLGKLEKARQVAAKIDGVSDPHLHMLQVSSLIKHEVS